MPSHGVYFSFFVPFLKFHYVATLRDMLVLDITGPMFSAGGGVGMPGMSLENMRLQTFQDSACLHLTSGDGVYDFNGVLKLHYLFIFCVSSSCVVR